MDKKAKRILTQTFWSSSGWKPGPPLLSGEDFEYAREQGVMFDPLTLDHNELIKQLVALHHQISQEQVAAAFLHSLSTRKIHLRSALASWLLTHALPAHSCDGELSPVESCSVCHRHGLVAQGAYVQQDLNVLQFERIKWGGIRLNWLLYIWLDLQEFTKESVTPVTPEDIATMQAMLDTVRACAPSDSARKLEQRWKGLLPASKDERDVLMEVLGYAGILAITDKPRVGRRTDNDFASMDGWQGQDGYDSHRVSQLFGKWGIR